LFDCALLVLLGASAKQDHDGFAVLASAGMSRQAM
jgi:hypothetical protein